MKSALTRVLAAGAALLLLSACSVTYVAPKPGLPILKEPTLAPTLAPSRGAAAGNVECSRAVGSGGAYGLFGAPAADFNAAHPASSLLVRCATDGKVIVLQLDISPAASAAAALATARRQLPADLKPVYDKRDVNCRNLQFKSVTLASLLGPDDPDGVVNIELESALATDFKYDAGRVDTAVIHQQYELNQTAPCLRG